MFKISVLFISLFSFSAISNSVLFDSTHSLSSGQAEVNSFDIQCKTDCFFTVHTVVSKFDSESNADSGAMYRVWNKQKTDYILFGTKINKSNKLPEVVISYSGKNIVLAQSQIGQWEGYKFKWNKDKFYLTILRQKAYENYTQLVETSITHTGKLLFSPDYVEYLFLGVDVTQYIDLVGQNINPMWAQLASGN